jgi:hypothetical protein
MLARQCTEYCATQSGGGGEVHEMRTRRPALRGVWGGEESLRMAIFKMSMEPSNKKHEKFD